MIWLRYLNPENQNGSWPGSSRAVGPLPSALAIHFQGEEMEKTKEYLNGWLNAIEDVKKNAMVFVRPSIERYPREYIDGYYAGRNAFKNAKAVSERSNSEEKQYLIGI
tara:strand:- start:976 stop:1299 length:324 start_codon:yes stop_codon:yes gene_type:complete